MNPFKEHIFRLLHKEIEISHSDIEVPPDPKMGDYAFPTFQYAKKYSKNPAELADELAKKIKPDDMIKAVDAKGPYLNFYIDKHRFSEYVLDTIAKERDAFGRPETESKGRVLIESPGPNTNKPLHLGHLRNMLLGSTLFNVMRFSGFDAHIINIVNDRGVHICKSMLAYQKLGNGKTPGSEKRKPDHFVGDYYVEYAKLFEKDPDIELEVGELLRKWEAGDPETRKLWEMMNSWALEGFRQTYGKLHFSIEKEYLESESYLDGKNIVMDGLKRKIFVREADGSIVADLTDRDLGKKVLLRADGTSIYITQDLFVAKSRYDDYKFDRMIYVVGNEQEHHFRVLFELFRMLKWEFADRCYHFSYGLVELPEGRMKSREGTVIDTDDLIDQMIGLAGKEVSSRYGNLPQDEIGRRAEAIGMAAIRFFFLKFDPLKNFVFDPKASLSFEGETGPYLQYTYARITSIFRKGCLDINNAIGGADFSVLNEGQEFRLVKHLDKFPAVLEKITENYKTSLLANYAYELAQAFNEFYHACPILQETEEVKKFRLLLAQSVAVVLRTCFGLMSIDVLDEM
ncbi:arginine--tRNA ligase [Candidatus Woesearchaeota archaeon]|nr:arginine--tRNA ligase [Candidatus Woesearchaeota archaeon]